MLAADLQRDGRAAGWIRPRTTARRPGRTFMRRSDTADLRGRGDGCALGVIGLRGGGHGRSAGVRETERAAASRQHANRAWASKRGPPSVVVERSTQCACERTAGDSGHGRTVPHPAGHRALPARRSNGVRFSEVGSGRFVAPMQDIPVANAQGRGAAGSSRYRAGPAPDRRSGRPSGRPVGEHERVALRLGEGLERREHGLARRVALRRGGGRSATAAARPRRPPSGDPTRGRPPGPLATGRARASAPSGADTRRARRGWRRTPPGGATTRRKTSCTTSCAWRGVAEDPQCGGVDAALVLLETRGRRLRVAEVHVRRNYTQVVEGWAGG